VRVRRPSTIGIGAVLAGVLLAAIGAGLWRVQGLLLNVGWLHSSIAALVIGSCGVAIVAVGVSGAWRQVPVALAIGAAIAFPALQYGLFTSSGDDTVEQVARAVAAARRSSEPIGTHHVFVRNLVFYTQDRTVDLIFEEQLEAFLGQPGRALVVAPAEAIEQLEQAKGRRYPRLAEFPYFNPAAIRLRTLLAPVPAQDLSRVVLIANR
jgi:hypothetical protein